MIFMQARTVAEDIIATVKLMAESGLPCYDRGAPIDNLRTRFHLEMSDQQAAAFMLQTINDAYDKVSLLLQHRDLGWMKYQCLSNRSPIIWCSHHYAIHENPSTARRYSTCLYPIVFNNNLSASMLRKRATQPMGIHEYNNSVDRPYGHQELPLLYMHPLVARFTHPWGLCAFKACFSEMCMCPYKYRTSLKSWTWVLRSENCGHWFVIYIADGEQIHNCT